jgi:WhiB family redox-sensing transcriptional regulator
MPFQATRVPVTRQSAEAGWQSRGACQGVDPELFFPPEKVSAERVRVQEAIAKAVCRSCPVAGLCLSSALEERLEFGVRGGLTAEDRKAVLVSRSGTQPMPATCRTADPAKRTRVRRRTTVRRTTRAGTATSTASDVAPVGVRA